MRGNHSIIQAYLVKTVSRDYRSNFSQAYKVLYKEGELSYLTEILDSAQEGSFSFSQVFLTCGSIVRNIRFLSRCWTMEVS